MDIAITSRRFSSTVTVLDWAVEAGDLAKCCTLEVAVLLSLYTDRDAPDGVDVPEGLRPHIWWGQAYWGQVFAAAGLDIGDIQLGSLRWLLVREKATEQTKARSIQYDRDALDWMITLGLAEAIDVQAEWSAPGHLATTIIITKPDGLAEKYQAFWEYPT